MCSRISFTSYVPRLCCSVCVHFFKCIFENSRQPISHLLLGAPCQPSPVLLCPLLLQMIPLFNCPLDAWAAHLSSTVGQRKNETRNSTNNPIKSHQPTTSTRNEHMSITKHSLPTKQGRHQTVVFPFFFFFFCLHLFLDERNLGEMCYCMFLFDCECV